MKFNFEKCGKLFCTIIFISFATFQIYITAFSSADWYPFSAYRMFSKNWPNGITMERIRYKSQSSGQTYYPWELIKIPFFQANQISFKIFLDSKDDEAKSKLCSILNIPQLAVLREDVKYSLEGEMMRGGVPQKKWTLS